MQSKGVRVAAVIFVFPLFQLAFRAHVRQTCQPLSIHVRTEEFT